MSSNDSNTHPEYDPNIRIKDEPGTIPEPAVSTSPLIPNLIKTIKTEPGLPVTTSSTRLPSFRVPRDLTLGGNVKLEKPKKVYTPNLNVQRIKNREDQNAANKNESSQKTKGRGRDRGRGDKKKDKGKGRGKDTSNLVQSSGIFSEGLADLSSKRNSGGGGGGGGGGGFRDRESSGSGRESATTIERPKLSIPQKIDKAEEAEKLRLLLRDDFFVDNGLDIDPENTPVGLPMIHEGKLFKNEHSEKIDMTNEDSMKTVTLQNGEAKPQNKMKIIAPQVKGKDVKIPFTVPQVIENKLSSFILMQLPDCLPGLLADDKQNDPRSKRAPESSTENETDKGNKFCTLNNLKEGMLGKLQILRSGKARLVLGDNDLLVDVGSNLSFRQDLIAAKISSDKQSGDLVNLGPVHSTLICSPDWENMLKKI